MLYICNTIIAAAQFARDKHVGQFRKYNNPPVPYIVHPMRVAGRLTIIDGVSPNMIAAGWLHDTIEDTNTTYLELINEFGVNIADMVLGLTDISKQDSVIGKLPRVERKQKNNEYLLTQSPEVRLIKLCDIIDNVMDMNDVKDGFKIKFFNEKKIQTELIGDVYPPLADEILEHIEAGLKNP